MGPPSQASATPGKVAIPPLRPRVDPATALAAIEKKRTSKACAECRFRKIKCNGKRPTCDHCEQCQIPCAYTDGKREQNKKGLERGDRMLQLIRDISKQVLLPHDLRQKIDALESEIPEDDQSVASAQTAISQKRRRSNATTTSEKRRRSSSPAGDWGNREPQGEADTSAEVGSEESVDLTAEDFNQTEETRATGFIGKNSEVAWAQRLSHAQAEGAGTGPSNEGRNRAFGPSGQGSKATSERIAADKTRHTPGKQPDDKISDFTYHLDNQSVLMVDYVDKDELPPVEVATNLLECYMDTVQDVFPILTKSEFTNQFQQSMRTERPERLPEKWRAILNLAFAIGAKFSHLIGADWRGDDRDHLIYYTRARLLGMDNDAIVAHPDLQRIQIVGMLSFYYLIISQVSRSWMMIGLACRQAVALGLHLRNEDPSTTAVQKEKRVRVWWSLYCVEHLLCEITGRPTAINRQFCSVPAPAPIDEANLATAMGSLHLEEWNRRCGTGDSSSPMSPKDSNKGLENMPGTASQFRHRVKLATITQKIFVNLYSAETVSKSWEKAQDQIVALGAEVNQWYNSLPAEYQFGNPSASAYTRERTLLGFFYNSTKMLVNRPCLCQIDRRLKSQGERSKSITKEKARECVMAAKSMADLLPDDTEPDHIWIYRNGPWWCIVHHIMQAIAVLMLELAFDVCHMTAEDIEHFNITDVIKKLCRWLTKMAENGDSASEAACKQANQQFKGFSPFAGADNSELPQIAKHGAGDTTRSPPSFREHTPKVQLPGYGAAGWNSTQAPLTNSLFAISDSMMPDQPQETPLTRYLEQQQQPIGKHTTSGFQAMPYTSGQTISDQGVQLWPVQQPQQQPHQRHGQSEPWNYDIEQQWNTMVWQTSHDQINPFTSLSIQPNVGFSIARQQPGQSMTGAATSDFGISPTDMGQVKTNQATAQYGRQFQSYPPPPPNKE